ncbi:peptidase A4 family-domain-containing protein [Mycena metata]|uniref:Peptidase A4 family-domain-containing protein n=1 Tax=Mycena metata TaxID=1033252 RepID=A0AAD7IX75_9AGAR|nr:peptidase A4 family-domain-containing protein [Mycena metata]
MKAAVITAVFAASLATAEVTWTFQKFENDIEVPFPAGPATRFHSQAMIKLGEAGKRNRLNAAAAPVQSSNWCGAILTGSGFTSVFASWAVPPLSFRSGQSAASEPSLAQWVGIDGFTSPGLFQGGVLSQIVSGGQENVAFTGLLPQPLRDLGLAVSIGDSITTNVTVTSSSGGIVTIKNNSRGTAVVATVTGATGSDIIQGTSAEWIVQDVESGSSLVPFPAFPISSFTGATAIESGIPVSPPAGTTINLVQGVELCSATISGTTVSVRDS